MNDKRQCERYSCNGSGDLITQNNGRVWGHLGDISTRGFYLSTFGPWPVNTDVRFKIEVEGTQICGTGIVATSHPGVGMAVVFKDMTDDAQHALSMVVHELQGSSERPVGMGLRV
ncbi:type IV pilus assembly PilZ [Candidatus Koribacter versatilis Ellin345]|uniref:Type IV pilus assembly PilZ n=1 Tax=Koribacter versatilis (strain Ellin345) TaxID=204669 RepID=Q1IJA0_KORVE|nr:PilZ domain-containing protein [Candidatus Koribacter versatilis]ABF43050.1 type IV pilus assembly PilZ [Candidatus Koribacter versatilis Ellin345]